MSPYVPPPTITAVSPVAGLPGGGTVVTLTGTGFTGPSPVSVVDFGATAATVFNATSATSMTVTSPAGSPGTVDVTVTNAGGTSAISSVDNFTYETAPTITSVVPVAGLPAGASSVSITGTNFIGVSAVKFGSVSATSYTFNSATSITAISPAESAATVDVTVTTPVATSATSSADQFTYEAPPTVTAVTPLAGPLGGTSAVSITGTSFTGASTVMFGSSAASSYNVVSATSITAGAPAESAGTVDVVVTTPSGTSLTSSADDYTYEPAPTVSAVSPAVGTTTGGTSVVITGTNLGGASAVAFGANQAASYTFNSATQLTAVSAAAVAGTVDVVVTTPSGTTAISSADQFTFEAPPTVTGLSPVAGLPAGSTSVVITGTGFTGATAVKFGTAAATAVSVVSSTSITATSPSEPAGSVDVTVTTPVATSAVNSPADQFTFEGAPTVTAVAPGAGPLAGATPVVITGTNFTDASTVQFGTAAATVFSVVSATSITATSPAELAGAVDVTVTTPVATSATSASDQFSYLAAPSVTAVAPAAGPLAGGTSVTISGTGFIAATAVDFGTAAATYSITSSSSITATSPAAAAGVLDVTVTSPGGTSATSAGDYFTYVAAPTVSAVSPPAGKLAGGATVTITGTGFTGASAVSFGSTAVSYSVTSFISITATTPAEPAGTLDVTVTNPGGTSATSPADDYTYEVAPSVTGVSPLAGLPSGGSSVTITGTGFIGATAVNFGAGLASNVVVNSATSITATTPGEPAGIVDVVVTTPSGMSSTSASDQFTYEPAPTVSSISPVAGLPAGGTQVSITGTGFTGASAVSFGTGAATYSVISPTEITTTSPSGSPGAVDVIVATPSGASAASAADLFTYESAPAISAVSPVAGLPVGGSSVTITGTGFGGASAVRFGSNAATFSVVSATSISAAAPAGSAGTVDITVTTPVGTSTTGSADQFTYEAAPSVTGISPVAGLPAGGSAVTITGSGFVGASVVDFGPTAATYVVVSGTEISATTPGEAAGTVDVTVTTPVGTSITSTADQFTFEGAPAVSAVTPSGGSPAGGATVTIAGTGLIGATAVDFGASAADAYTVNSATSITATSPAESAGTVDITVTTPVGTSTTSSSDQFTYESEPIITSLNPAVGLPTGGSSVSIIGSNFTNATAVDFGSVPAAFTFNSATSITATPPVESAGTVDVKVTTPSGTNASTVADQFTYESVPSVSAVSPTAGLPGGATVVTITGAGLAGASAVDFGPSAATVYTVTSSTQVVATSPAGTGVVDVTVTTPLGTSVSHYSDQFTYEDAPSVSAVSPAAGLPSGGSSVTITGANFSGASAVHFGTVSATYNLSSSTQIIATAPAGTVGTADITVTTPVGTSATSVTDQFTYEGAPAISAVAPTAGLPVGGTSVTITGTGFVGASAVAFGSLGASSYTVSSQTAIVATTPAAPAGTIDVTVTTPVGISSISSADKFTFEAVPSVTAVSPVAGSLAGGTSVTITGTAFAGASIVDFGTTAASNLVINSSTSITVTAPAGSGTADITVTTPVGTSATSAADEFSYEAAPAITAVAPVAGLTSGGTTVTVTGTGFAHTSSVGFGSSPASTFTVISATEIAATSPAELAGVVDISVTTPVGTSSPVAADQFTYEGTPAVSAVSPSAGLPAGGSAVTITGFGFTHVSAVDFGAVAGTITSSTATSITVTSPAELSGTVDVTVTTPSGTSATSLLDEFTYESAPSIGAIAPVAGPITGGTTVTVTGTNFTGASGVSFGLNAAATYTVASATSLTVTSPAAPTGTVDVTVTTPSGTSAITAADEFTYESTPTITALSPIAGPLGGGTLVTITGTNFTGANQVSFGSTAATGYTVVSPSTITATSPAGSAGGVDVTVKTGTGTSPAVQFTYENGPTLSTISPLGGSPAGGTAATITGSNFTGATSIDFGTTATTSFTVDSSVLITVTSPASSAGTFDVTVVTPTGTSAVTTADEFTYEPAPSVSNVGPVAGLPTGNTPVTLTGANFTDATAVYFGTSAATSFTVVSATQITATSPPGVAGAVDVEVTTPSGTSTANPPDDQFTYEAAPAVTAVSPVAGVPAGGATVSIGGTGFTGASAVHFGAVSASGYTVNSPTSITVTSPVAAVGTIDVTVTTPSGTSALSAADEFSYEAVPSITALSPMAGLGAGSTTVTLTGSGFTSASAVNFGTSAATSYTVTSSTQITAISPAAGEGTVDVSVTTPIGTSTVVAADEFTYEGVPSFTALSPVAGPTTGGTSVTITGSNFTDVSAVHFGTVAATFSFNSPTSITASSPVASAGTVDVTITTPIGTSATSAAAQFAYEAVPTVTAVSPVAGLTSGGTALTISGTSFTDVTAVNFGATSAASFTVLSSTSIAATAPAQSASSVDVTVVTPVGSSAISPADQFTYESVPDVTAVAPAAGSLSGGTSVVITGDSLSDTTGVSFGSVAAASFVLNSPTEITAISPPEPAGTVYVTVTTPVGTSATSAAAQFIFEAAPAVTAVAPIAGAALGGHLGRHHRHRLRRGHRCQLRLVVRQFVPRHLGDTDHRRLPERDRGQRRCHGHLSGGNERRCRGRQVHLRGCAGGQRREPARGSARRRVDSHHHRHRLHRHKRRRLRLAGSDVHGRLGDLDHRHRASAGLRSGRCHRHHARRDELDLAGRRLRLRGRPDRHLHQPACGRPVGRELGRHHRHQPRRGHGCELRFHPGGQLCRRHSA